MAGKRELSGSALSRSSTNGKLSANGSATISPSERSVPPRPLTEPLEDIELAGEWFQVDLKGLEQPGHHSPVSDGQNKFDDLRRAQMLLESFHGLALAFYVDRYLIGQLQNQALQFAEAFGVLPVLDRRDLLFGHAYVPGSRHVLGPFVDRVAGRGGLQYRHL